MDVCGNRWKDRTRWSGRKISMFFLILLFCFYLGIFRFVSSPITCHRDSQFHHTRFLKEISFVLLLAQRRETALFRTLNMRPSNSGYSLAWGTFLSIGCSELSSAVLCTAVHSSKVSMHTNVHREVVIVCSILAISGSCGPPTPIPIIWSWRPVLFAPERS